MAQKKNITGFTLIELLVVIAIIGLLLAIVVPSMNKAKYIARRVICAGRMNQVGVAMKVYADTYKDLVPNNKALLDDGKVHIESHGYTVYRNDWTIQGRLAPLRFGYLYNAGLIDMPELFYCPNNRDATFKYESYTSPTQWGTLPQTFNTTNQWVRIGYTYYPVERTPKLLAAGYPDPDQVVTKYSMLNINIPYATDVLHGLKNVSHQYNSRFDAEGNVTTWGTMAVNALYGDGRVTTCTDMTVFKNDVWDRFKSIGTLSDYDYCYYNIFKLIGP